MKALKTLGVIILILIAVFLIVPLFLPHDVNISSEKTIHAKAKTVFEQVNNLKNWKRWSPFETDTTMVDTFEGPESGVGAKRTWKGERSGTGSLMIVKSEPYKLIENKLIFGENNDGAKGTWNFQETGDSVKVTWTIFINDLKYPFERWYGLMSRSVMEPLMKRGLDSLDALAVQAQEKAKKSANANKSIKVIEVAAQPALTILDSTTIDGIGKMLEKDYGLIMEYVKKKEIAMTGFPFAVYYNWDPKGTIVIRAGVPVAEKTNGHEEIEYFELPAGKAIYARHIGGFNTGPTHYAIDEFIKTNHPGEPEGYIWEVYVSGPSTEPDSTKWETDIYYPLK
jgi:effector-binding domain-containing protein